jgi:predicted esterase
MVGGLKENCLSGSESSANPVEDSGLEESQIMNFRFMRRIVLASVMLVVSVVFAQAQDAGQVLRLSVGYGTLKNSTEMTPERRAEVDQLGKLAQQASAAGKYGDAMKHLYHAMSLMRGQEWTAWRALGQALTIKLERAVMEPGQSVGLKLGQMYAIDEKLEGKLAGSIGLAKMSGGEIGKGLAMLEPADPDFMTRPYETKLTVPDVEDGNYRLEVRLKPASGEPVTRAVTVHIERGLQAQVAIAKGRVGKLDQALRAKQSEALLAALPCAEYRISLFDLASSSQINFERINFREELKEANSILDQIEAGGDPFAARRGDFRRAYRSKTDDTLQPYRVFLPGSYDGSKPYPLVIALHGMGGDENSYFDQYANGAFKMEAEKRGYIVACPKGRQPASMYVGTAEQDVMDVIAEMRRSYRVDPDRIYLTGHSMGGFGSWSIAIDHPEVFAAIAPISGGGNPSAMSKIAHIPQLVVHGDNDKTVPVERSRTMVAAAKALGAEVKYIEVPKGSHVDVAVPAFKDVYDWFDHHRRKRAEAKAAAGGAKTQ